MTKRGKRALASLNKDIEEHIQHETEDNITRGMSPDEALYAAIRKFGNRSVIQEETRAIWRAIWLDQSIQDLHYAVRMLRRNLGFTIVAVVILMLGVGMMTAVFSVLDTLLIRPLPYPNPDRLVWISHACQHSSGDCFMARSDYVVLRERAHAFDSMALLGNEDIAMSSSSFLAGVQTKRIGSIEGDFWRITGAHAALGRLFGPKESNVVVLTWGLFHNEFHANPAILGKELVLEGHTFTITGVLSPNFQDIFPQALYTGDEPRNLAAYIPASVGHELPGDPIKPNSLLGPAPSWFRVVGRLKPGVSFASAHAEVQAIYDQLAKEYPHTASHGPDQNILRFQKLSTRLREPVQATLITLFGAALFVFLIAVGNISNLLLARSSTRGREIAIRSAIGAGPWRVLRQFLVESVTLAVIGGTFGVLLADLCLRIITQTSSGVLPRLNELRIDTPVLVFALTISCLAAVLFGAAPSLVYSRQAIAVVLTGQSGNATAMATLLRARRAFVITQVGLAMILLLAAALMLKSFREMNSYPAGFDPQKIVSARILLSGPAYDHNWLRQKNYLERLTNEIASIPGVQVFGIDCGMMTQPLTLSGDANRIEPISGAVRYLSLGYLRALGIPLVNGTWPKTDDQMLDRVAVNKTLASEISGNIVGRQIKGLTLSATVAGVVSDFKDRTLDAEPLPQVYASYMISPAIRSVRLLLRVSIAPGSVMRSLRQSLGKVDKQVPILELQTLAQELSQSVAARRFNFFVLGIFSATALILALTGIYGVISYVVNQRTSEIGIRMSLGATPAGVLGMILAEGMLMILGGILLGLGGALGLSRILSSLLYGVRPTDMDTLAAASITFACVGLLACLVPALRAARIDPVLALRHD